MARVEAVIADKAADLGVVSVVEADMGVKGVRALGESSVRAERRVGSTGVLPDRRRLRDICLVRRGAGEAEAGMTRGARLLGESGSLASRRFASAMPTFAISSSAFSSRIWASRNVRVSARLCGFHELPGALIDRS